MDFSSLIAGNIIFAPGSGSLTDASDIETLTLPIDDNLSIQADGEPLELNVSGDIVATTVIPEPGAIGLLAASGLLLLRNRRR